MDEKGGLVDRILKSSEDLGRDGQKGVHRKKITLDDLNKVIVEYVHKTAGMGDPELRSRIVRMELQMGTLQEQAAALQRALEQARAGWKASQDQIAALAREKAGMVGGGGPELAEARKEASEAREEAARAKGRLAALENSSSDWSGKYAALLQKAEKFASRLDEALRAEKKARADLQAAEQRAEALRESHRREVESLRAQIDALSAGYDHVELLPRVDFEAIVERAKAAGARAADLSVDVPPPVREALERLEARCGSVRLALEAMRDEAAAKVRSAFNWEADFPAVQRVAELHRRALDVDLELGDLERVVEAFAPQKDEKR